MKLSRKFTFLLIILLIIYIYSTSAALSIKEEEVKIEKNPNWWEKFQGDRNNNKIEDKIENMERNERINIFIDYDSHPSEDDVASLSNFDLDVKYVYKYIDVICARNVAVSDVKTISSFPHVVMVKLEPKIYPMLDVSARAVKARESDEYSPNTAFEIGSTGSGVSIAILDSGVDDLGRTPSQRHESLDDLDDNPATTDPKFIAGVDFTQEETFLAPRDGSYNPDDTASHGTHCAGIAMGTGGTSGLYMGVAPGARLVDVKVIEDYGIGNTGDTMAGLEWCIDHQNQYNIRVLSLSLGGLQNSDGSDEESQLVNTAVEAGLVVVVAIGNDGELPPKGDGNADNSNLIPKPAAADKAITVGSVYDHETVGRSDDTLSDFSFSGPRLDDGDDDPYDELKPDVVVYGEDIESAQANTNSGYIEFSGTSMACPHIAGIVALMLDANPSLTPENVKNILHASAEQKGSPSFPNLDPKYNTHYGWGIADAYKAVEMARGYVDVQINIDQPTKFENLKGTVEIKGTASVDRGSISLVEVSIDDPNFQLDTMEAEGTFEWSVPWDTIGWNGQRTIYARAKSGEYSDVDSVEVIVANPTQGDGNGELKPNEGPPKIELPFGLGKVSVYAAAAFIVIIIVVIVSIIAAVLLRRRKKILRMIEERRAKQGFG